MGTFFIISTLIALVLLIIGLIKPKTVGCNSRKKAALTWGLIFLFCFIMGAVFSDNKENATTKESNVSSKDGAAPKEIMQPEEKPIAKENWFYEEAGNEMDDSKTYYATIAADEQLQFKFPYNGGTDVYIAVRNKEGKNEVMIEISQGQFLTGVRGCQIRVRFDESPAQTFSCTGPSDYSTTFLFVDNAKKFIEGMKKAKKTIIECEFYQEGNQIIKFNTDGLRWEY